MLQPRARWLFPTTVPADPALLETGTRLGLTSRVVELLARRGIASVDELAAYVGEPRDGLHDPRLLPDADRLLARVTAARDRGERVLVFGDFDADGITGLAILTLALRAFGVTVIPYVPSRLDEGHGLSMAAVEAAVREGAGVIITVDTGTTSVAEVAAAADRGIDVIVTDHHRVPAVLPAAAAIVNAHRPDSAYPDDRLSGAGIAFTVARLLLGDEGALEFADLAAIGTVADVAPILGENRLIVRLGLALLRGNPRPGIAALLARANVTAAAVDVETIGFALAPRLNAAGRMGEAIDAAHLLLAADTAEAEGYAATLEAANTGRRDLMKGVLAEARTAPDVLADAPATMIRGPWPVGIIGLVAGRLAEELGRPAIIGAELGDAVRASCRGDGTIHLADALAACDDLLIRHGGHAGAAGFEVAAEHWDALRQRLLAIIVAGPAPDPRPTLSLDLALPAADVDYCLFADLARLAPCGTGNPEPLVAVLGLTVMRAREATGGHSQLVLKRRLDVLDGIAFGWPELAGLVTAGDRVDVVARLVSRRFGGIESLQLEIRDAAPSGSYPEARAILGGGLVAVGPGLAAAAAPPVAAAGAGT
ncbi:MAG: single-stranded-DNA-specific exonuclease RecJ [Chloroflexi bacterium]|nr:single-stranded-DNA-specific exonuclease RecJ [Chloroflexota bacterium]